jgi:hypothetical protein
MVKYRAAVGVSEEDSVKPAVAEEKQDRQAA